MEGWAYWHALSELALPVRSQLSHLIFDKALRRRNLKSASQECGELEGSATQPAMNEHQVKSHQATVNLVGIDTERLAYFLQYHFLILNGMGRLCVFSAFLIHILGWLPFTAGIAAWASTLPANTYFSKRVLAESRSLMKHRDSKLSKINEMLLGMRQIKFSASEAQWERRIIAIRDLELETLWKFFLADSGLFACWVISPILLAVASLATYTLINGSLLPSVAFVSIGVFGALETTLGSLPELFTLGLDSLVSIRRINAYLSEPDRQDVLTEGLIIGFQDATVSWHVDEQTPGPNRFILHEINLTFPHGALSVISGKVGSGKTLLLSAILGEVDLLSGAITVAKPDNSYGAHLDDWIIPGSIAYVSQIPWLENASIRNNILFGLLFDKVRYNSVVAACALNQDFASLPDGDATDLGANGVNLSGGQKWRVTLARAVYSRAEVLLLEDIFSAVDSHVGAWILEKCLLGSICNGRTRILVTHHLGLVLSEADYLVELGEGRVIYAGPPQYGVEGYSQPPDPETGTGSDLSINNSPKSRKPQKRRRSTHINVRMKRSTSKKFVQEEVRQKGTVKGSVYLAYIKSSGGPRWWAACIGIYLAYQAGILGSSTPVSYPLELLNL